MPLSIIYLTEKNSHDLVDRAPDLNMIKQQPGIFVRDMKWKGHHVIPLPIFSSGQESRPDMPLTFGWVWTGRSSLDPHISITCTGDFVSWLGGFWVRRDHLYIFIYIYMYMVLMELHIIFCTFLAKPYEHFSHFCQISLAILYAYILR